jgi:tetratricopeptide (TPR) repeat protein
MQEHARSGPDKEPWLERLGWAYVAKARESFDPGYYKLAEQCALCLESQKPGCPEGLLLRGHVLQNLHQFKEAEPLARQLVSQRGLSFDYALLGDVLMEQGRLDEAAGAYQQMVNQRPDLESYARISHLRWLKGDLDGAIEVMKLAVTAASPKAPEPAAWVNTRLAFLEFQDGNISAARQSCEVALDYQPEHAPALLLQGRLLLAEGKTSEAVESLQHAVQINPLPEYQWILSEALHATGREQEAREVEAQLNREGAATDPRTFALFLATTGANTTTAVELARKELTARGDVFTHDALAWSLASNGQFGAAHEEIEKALAEGTRDGRLFFHAAVIAAKAGDKEQAQLWFEKAAPLLGSLLPSEQHQLLDVAVEVGDVDAVPAEDTTSTVFAPGS